MDKLEHYLDQVCRGIAGPRAMRQSIRQELKEHLLDAAAEYTREGLTEPEAITRALEDFGGPEQVRREMEATHGHRLMGVVIDKALQWKEMTMKSKWLWTTWAHLALAIVITLQVLFICFAVVFISPKCIEIVRDFGSGDRPVGMLAWMPHFLNTVWIVQHYALWWLIPLVICWGLFEWRVRSEDKTFIRLSIMGTAAIALMVAVAMTAASLVLPLLLVAPEVRSRYPEPIVQRQVAAIDESIAELQQAYKTRNWEAMHGPADDASNALRDLAHTGAAAPALLSLNQQPRLDDLRAQLKLANEYIRELRQAIRDRDAAAFETAMRKVQQIHGQLRAPTTQRAP